MNKLQILLQKHQSIYFISPHLDDAAFSAGGLISSLVDKASVHVVNVFTSLPPTKFTLSAQAYLRQCHASSAESLQLARVKEDRLAFSQLGLKPHNLDLPDALWRVKNFSLYNVFPELGAVYPTYRWHISKGVPVVADAPYIVSLSKKLASLIPPTALVFAPLGIGNHVDHVIVRNVCSRLPNLVIFWADYPYQINSPLPHKYIDDHQLQPFEYSLNKTKKIQLMSGYKSQVPAIFPQGIPDLPPEIYFL